MAKFEKVEKFRLSPEMLKWVKTFKEFDKAGGVMAKELQKYAKTPGANRKLLVSSLIGVEAKKEELMKMIPPNKTVELEGQVKR